MYEQIPGDYYTHLTPDSTTHSGSEGWTHAPVPGWGQNPMLAYPSSIGDDPSNAMVKAMKEASKSVVWQTSTPPAAYVPYPVYRAVPTVHFNETTPQSSAPWGTFPSSRAYEGVGAYYAESELRSVSGIGEDAPAVAAANEQAAARAVGRGLAAGGLILAVSLGAPLVLGTLGYWIGGKVAPSDAQRKAYKWAGSLSNIVLPLVGPAVLAVAGALQSRDVRSNPRRNRSRKSRHAPRRRSR